MDRGLRCHDTMSTRIFTNFGPFNTAEAIRRKNLQIIGISRTLPASFSLTSRAYDAKAALPSKLVASASLSLEGGSFDIVASLYTWKDWMHSLEQQMVLANHIVAIRRKSIEVSPAGRVASAS
jgi:hypothetical protein